MVNFHDQCKKLHTFYSNFVHLTYRFNLRAPSNVRANGGRSTKAKICDSWSYTNVLGFMHTILAELL